MTITNGYKTGDFGVFETSTNKVIYSWGNMDECREVIQKILEGAITHYKDGSTIDISSLSILPMEMEAQS